MYFDYIELTAGRVRGSWNPKKINTMLYGNGVGKSTFIEAIRFLLTGDSDRDSISVTAKADLVCISRTKEPGKTPVCVLGGKKVSGTALTDFVTSRMSSLPGIVKMQMNPGVSLTDPKTLMTNIMSRIPEDLNETRLIEYAKRSGLPEECVPKLSEYVKESVSEEFGLEKIDKIVETIRTKRLGLAGKLLDVTAMIRQTNAVEPSMTPEQIEELIRRSSDAESEKSFNDRLMAWERMAKEQKSIADEIARIEKEISGIGTVAPLSEAERKAAESTIDANYAKTVEMQKSIAAHKANIALFKKTLAALCENVCPISGRIVCTVDKTGLKEEVESALKANESSVASLSETFSKITEDKKRCEEIIRKDNEERRKAERLSHLESTLSTKKMLVKDLPARPEKKTSLTGLDIDVLKKDLANALAWKRKQELVSEDKRLSEEIEQLRTIENVLRGETKSVIISTYIDVLSDCVNDAIRMFPGYTARLVTKNGSVAMMVKIPGEQTARPAETLSTGERLIADMALSVMLNEISKTGLLFIDNVECLDRKNLESLKAILEKKKFTDSFDHVFICGVAHPEVKAVLESIKDVNKM